jgi:beta-glucosidase
MCSYNKINGTHASDSKELLTDILRDQWGFDGTVITDWGAMNDRIAAMKAGCDLNMPGGTVYMESDLAEAVRSGRLDEADIDACVERILRLAYAKLGMEQLPADFDAHHALALEVAQQGAVLLKNEGNILPLAVEDMVLIGHMAQRMRYQGSGSSHINPKQLVQLTDVLTDVPYLACCAEDGSVTEEALEQAAALAAQGKVAVVVAGLPDVHESEAFDRDHMHLPEGHDRMIEAVAAANSNTVVILLGGSPAELPWAEKVKAILYMGLPGQAGGQAMADLLTGRANPSGKLTETWPVCYDDVICRNTFGMKNPEYREGIYVGYRYYDKAGKTVRYPFGHGLSYTTFRYDDLEIGRDHVSVSVTNTGAVPGAEVVQLYVAPPQDGFARPEKELKGFARVELQPGETKIVTMPLDSYAFALWADGWKTPAGTYGILVGASCQDIRLQGECVVDGCILSAPEWQKGSWYETLTGTPSRGEWEQLMGHPVPVEREPVKGEFHMDCTCAEMKDHSFIMKIQYKVTENVIAKSFGGKKDLSDPAYRMMLTCATDCPMRSVIISSGGMMKESLAKGLLHMANGHYIKGLKAMLGK